MKKIIVLLLTILTILTFSVLTVNAEELELESEISEIPTESATDGEIANESDFLSESVETPTESEITETAPKYELTKEELTEIINGALTENQKETATKISEVLGRWFNISPDTIYLLVAGAIIVIVVVAFFIVKYISKSGNVKQLQEQVTALAEMLKEKEKESKLGQALDVLLNQDGLQDLVKCGYETFSNEIKKHIDDTRMSDETVGTLLTKTDIATALLQKEFDALKIILAESGNIGAINELANAPETAVLERLEFENAKLKHALGEDAVKKLLQV